MLQRTMREALAQRHRAGLRCKDPDSEWAVPVRKETLAANRVALLRLRRPAIPPAPLGSDPAAYGRDRRMYLLKAEVHRRPEAHPQP